MTAQSNTVTRQTSTVRLLAVLSLVLVLVLAGSFARAEAPQSAQADTAFEAQFEALYDALQLDETVRIMREEGLHFGESLAQDMLPDADPVSWERHVSVLYDPAKMRGLVRDRLAVALNAQDLSAMTAFFTSDLGAEIIGLELSAREAFLEPEVEDAAKEHYEMLSEDRALIVTQIEQLMEDSDLIERNVMGILNSNFMLYRGLADGGALEMSEAEMLSDVWGQEQDVRDDSFEWLGAYLLMAYQPLEEADVERYIAFWRSDEGQALNSALFATFDKMYAELAYLMGQSVAQHMRSQKL